MKRPLIWLLIALPIIIFYSFIWHNALGIPFQDDIDGILGVLQDLLKAQTFAEKLQILITQDDEHRVTFDRLVTYTLYLLHGEVNLKTHLLIGCTLILGIFGMIAYTFKKVALPLYTLIPVAYFLFQIQYYEGIFWNMIPCQNFAVLFFALLSIFLVNSGSRWALGIAFATVLLATFSSGNGMLTFLPCLLILVYQRRWKTSIAWTIYMILSILAYFHNLTIPSFRPKPTDNLRHHPLTIVADFPAFIGQYFDPGTGFSLKIRGAFVVLAGVVLIAWILFLAWKMMKNWWKQGNKISQYSTKNQSEAFFMGGLLLILATAAVFALARAGDGFEAVLTSRYKLNVAIFMSLIYAITLLHTTLKQQKSVFWVGLGIAVFMNGLSYFQLTEKVQNFRKDLITDAFSWQFGQNLPSSPIYFAQKSVADETINFNLQHHTYHFPTTVTHSVESQILHDTIPQNLAPNLAINIQESPDYLNISSDSFVQGTNQDDGAYIILQSPKETHLFPTRQRRNGLKFFITTQRYYHKGFVSVPILKQALAKGRYRIGLLVIEGNTKTVHYTQQTIQIEKSLKEV